MRGDDAVLFALIGAFVIAGLAYYFLSMRESEPEAEADTWVTRTADWFSSWFETEPLTKPIDKDEDRESGTK